MRQSNAYIIGFSAVVTIICGGLLAFASVSLKPMQSKQIELDTKKNILGAVTELGPKDNVLEIFDEKVKGFVIDYQGNVIEGEDALVLVRVENLKNEFKKGDVTKMHFPVFTYESEVFPGQVEAYVLPMFGNGLWDNVWGYVALESDFNTIKGAVFDHKAETPGLGARITDKEVQSRFVGKKIFDGSTGELVSIHILKGEGHETLGEPHQVDGLSGATMTTQGVNDMLSEYLAYYEPYMNKVLAESSSSKTPTVDTPPKASSTTLKSHGVIGE